MIGIIFASPNKNRRATAHIPNKKPGSFDESREIISLIL